MRKWITALIVLILLFFPSCRSPAETPIQVMGRLNYLERGDYFPCSQCHDGQYQKANGQQRELKTEHGNIELTHGRSRFWCLVCHNGEKLDFLTLSEGDQISYDDGHRVCGNCHTTELEAFYAGKHSKVVTGPEGKQELLSCMGCHSAHNTHIEPAHPLPAANEN